MEVKVTRCVGDHYAVSLKENDDRIDAWIECHRSSIPNNTDLVYQYEPETFQLVVDGMVRKISETEKRLHPAEAILSKALDGRVSTRYPEMVPDKIAREIAESLSRLGIVKLSNIRSKHSLANKRCKECEGFLIPVIGRDRSARWIGQCETARRIEEGSDTDRSFMTYFIPSRFGGQSIVHVEYEERPSKYKRSFPVAYDCRDYSDYMNTQAMSLDRALNKSISNVLGSVGTVEGSVPGDEWVL